MLANGSTVSAVAQRLGDSVNVVSRVYIHAIDQDDEDAANALPH